MCAVYMPRTRQHVLTPTAGGAAIASIRDEGQSHAAHLHKLPQEAGQQLHYAPARYSAHKNKHHSHPNKAAHPHSWVAHNTRQQLCIRTQHQTPAHLSMWCDREDATCSSSRTHVAHSVPTSTPDNGPNSGARNTTSSTPPSWNLARGAGGGLGGRE